MDELLSGHDAYRTGLFNPSQLNGQLSIDRYGVVGIKDFPGS